MADIFDEIGEELRAERTGKLLARYGWVLAVLAVLVVAGAGGWQWWRDHERQQAAAAAGVFLAAVREVSSPAPGGGTASPARQDAVAAFERLETGAPESYRTLARLRAAAAQAGSDPAAALQAWDAVAHDPGADELLRGLATLQWTQHQLDTGDPAALDLRLRPLADGNGPWRPLAQEQLAWLDLRQGKTGDAATLLRGLAADPLAPQGVRARSKGLLGQLGEVAPLAGAAAPVATPVEQ